MNQFVLSSSKKGVTPPPSLPLSLSQNNIHSSNNSNLASSRPVFLPTERRATLDKFYFSTENFNVVMKLFQDLFRKEYHVILTKNDVMKSLVVRALASAKRKQPSLTTIVDMNKAAVLDGLPAIQRQVQLHPDVHIYVPPEQDFSLDSSNNESSQSYLEELSGSKVEMVINSDLENLDSLVSQSAMLHVKSPIEEVSNPLPFSAPSVETYSSVIASLAHTPLTLSKEELESAGIDIMQKFQEMQRLKLTTSTNDDNVYASVTDTITTVAANPVQSPEEHMNKVTTSIVSPDIAPVNETLKEEVIEENTTKSLDNTRRDSLSFPVQPEYTFLQHFVDISSVDRNFSVQEKFNRYYFSVTFQSEQRFLKPMPIYSNSPLIPSNSPNTNGLVPNPNYLPGNDLGNITGWYEIPSTASSKGLNIPERVSNVTQLSIDSVLLFFSNMDAQCADISEKCFGKTLLHYPYLLLQIEELVSVYKSTNSFYAHNVIKVVRDKTWSQATCGDGFHLFRPVGNEMFTFPSPIASLNRLTIRVLNPMGNELCMQQETLLVKNINVVQIADPINSANQVWIIEINTANYFAVCQFYADHIVRFQDLTFYGSTSLSPFVNWLQDSNGHSIFFTPITSPDSTVPISNKFYIKYPILVNWETGVLEPMSFGSETFTSLNNELNTYPLINGSVYNTTIQTHVGFNVISRNMKNSFMSDNIRA